uniref:Uncharacterized protein n=1 Tax=Arundo donax TaxID=35708 RepID=A0A0A9BGI1_ARUDO
MNVYQQRDVRKKFSVSKL